MQSHSSYLTENWGNLRSRQIRKLTATSVIALVLCILMGAYVQAQTITNYVATRATNASFYDMSSGTSTVLAPATGNDDVASTVQNLPFDFWLMGTRYSTFSANSNGGVQLGSTSPPSTVSTSTAGALGVISGDNAIISSALNANAGIFSKTFGTAPNRVFVIQTTGHVIPYNNYTSDATNTVDYQVWLEEGTNKVTYCYGTVVSRTSAAPSRQVFISGGSPLYINSSGVATTTSSSLAPAATAGAAFPIVSGGSSNVSRVTIVFDPTAAASALGTPTNLTVGTATATSIPLSWTAAANATGYEIYYSTSGSNFGIDPTASNSGTYGRISVSGGSTVTATVTGLNSTSPYYFKVFARREGLSAPATASGSLLTQPVTVTSVAVSQGGTGAATRSQTNVPLLLLTATSTGNSGSYSLSSVNLSLGTGVNTGVITGLRVYRTTTFPFSTTTQLGTGTISLSGSTITIDASNAGAGFSTTYASGTNYFWIAGDLSATAPYTSVVDLAVTGNVTFSTGILTPSTPDPTGSYAISPLVANYTATRTTGTFFAPAVSPTVYLQGTSLDDTPGSLASLPFTFNFAGTNYTQFSANSNGQVQLGGSVIASEQSSPLSSAPVLCPISGDNAILSNSLVSSAAITTFTSGTAPNRIFVIQFSGLVIPYNSYTTDASNPSSYQIWLEETTNNIRYVYGPVLGRTASSSRSAFLSSGSASSSNSYYISGTTGVAVATGTASTITSAASVGGAFPFISGGADGARIAYSFTYGTLPTVSTPANFRSTSRTYNDITLGWDDLSDEHGYVVYYSTSAPDFDITTINAVTGTSGFIALPANTTTYTVAGLSSTSVYYFKLVAAKGSVSAAASTSESLLPLPITVASGAVTQAGTGNVGRGQTNVPLLLLTSTASGNSGTYSLSSISLSLGTGVNTGIITGVRVYQTSTSTFSTANQVGTGTISLSGSTLTIDASNAGTGWGSTYSLGTNYFWITGNVASTAPYSSVVDLAVTGSVTFSTGSITPTTPNPTGSYSVVPTITDLATSRVTNGIFATSASPTIYMQGTGLDDNSGSVANLPFTFSFMGTNYTQFSANTNGQVQLGGSTIGSNVTPTSGLAILGAISGDNAVISNAILPSASISTFTVGTSPNRVFVVRFSGFVIPYGSYTTDATNPSSYQVCLEEGTNAVRYIYGPMLGRTASTSRSAFLSNGSASSSNSYWIDGTTGNAVATGTTTTITSAASAGGAFPQISGGIDGARVVYSFVPNDVTAITVAAPTALTINAIGGMAVSWTDASNEAGYEVFYSSTAGFTPNFAVTNSATDGRISLAANTTSVNIPGLTVGTRYYIKVYSKREKLSTTFLSGDATILDALVAPTAVAVSQAGTGTVSRAQTNVPLLLLTTSTLGTTGTYSLSSLAIATGTNVDAATITNIRVYRTTTSTFSTTTQLGTGGMDFSRGTLTIDLSSAGTGFNRTFSGGTNYFWVTGDIAANAPYLSTADIILDGDILFNNQDGDIAITATTPDPTGAYTVSPLVSSYTVSRTTGTFFAPSVSPTTYLQGTGLDDVSGSTASLPFAFNFAGTSYTQFSANSNGQIRLGGSTIAAEQSSPTSGGAILCAISGDNAVLSNALVSSAAITTFTTGTAPNRIFVIQYSGFVIPYNNYTSDATFPSSYQVWLEETSNNVRYVYGPMLGRTAGSTRSAFLSSGAASNTNSYWIDGTTGAAVATGTTTSITSAATAGGAFPFISGGATDGGRIAYSFTYGTLPTVSTPTNFTSTGRTAQSITLGWDDLSDEHGYVLYYSTSGANFDISAITSNDGLAGFIPLAANTTTYEVPNLTSNSVYYFKLVAAKGSVSAAASTSQSLLPQNVAVATVSVTQAGTGSIAASSTLVPVLALTATTTGNSNTYTLSSINLALGSGATAGTITGIRVYRSATNNFSNAVQLGTGAIAFTGSTLTINASNAGSGFSTTTFSAGTNYFWILANVSASAAINAVVDLDITGNISFSSGDVTPTTPSPTGNYVVANYFTFESGAQGFTNSSTNTQNWVFTAMPAAGTAPSSLNGSFFSGYNAYPGPRAGSAGTQIWGTNLVNTPSLTTGANYNSPNYGNMDLVSAPFLASGPVSVSFYEWYACYFTQYQWVRIQYTTNNGTNWTDVATVSGQITPNAWTQRTISIPSSANDVVRVRWQYSAYAVYQPGYFFDDFSINAPLLPDVTAPTVTFASVANTASRSNRTITGLATISDPIPGYGLETSTSLKPRLYYKRSTDANSYTNNTSASNGWKYVTATNNASPYDFTIDYSLLSGGTGVVVDNIVQYFVVAQDAAPVANVGVTTGVTLAGTKTSVALTSANLLNVSGTIPSFTIIPGPLTLDNVLVTTPNSTATRGSANQVIGRVEVQVSGSTGTLTLTSLVLNGNTSGMTASNISNLKIFNTGSSSTFATTALVANTDLSGSGTTSTITFSGMSHSLAAGTNYLWITADISASATISNTLGIKVPINGVSVSDGTTPTSLPAAALTPTGTTSIILPVYSNLAYSVARSTGVDYTSIVGLDGTSTFGFPSFSSRDDAVSPNVDLSSIFTGFVFQGQTVNRIAISTNGHMQFNNDFTTTSTYQNDFSGAIRNSFAPFYDDLYCSTTDPNNHMFYRVDGISPNRVFTAEWISMEQFGHSGPDLNFQVKLYENGDRIEYVYGTMVGFNGSVDKAYDYTLGVFGGVSGTSQTTTTPTAGQYISQLYQNTTNFQNATYTSALTVPPVCNSKLTFTPNGSFTNGTSASPTIANTTCASATSIGLTFGAVIDNCNVYRSALVTGSPTAPAICATAVANGNDDAAWFSFYNDSQRDIVILVNASGGFAPSIQLASSCSVALACTSTTTQGGVSQLNYTGLPVGTYYVRVNHNGTGVTGTPNSGGTGSGMFTMSVYTTASAPANDVCAGATAITVNAAEFTGSTLNASSQTDTPQGVGTGTDPDDDDVWFSFTPTATSVVINSRGIAPFIPVVEVWSGSCPTAATSTANRILQSNPGVATQQANTLTGLTIGTAYYVRVYHRATGAPASGNRQFVLSVTIPRPACPTISSLAATNDTLATPANGATGIAYGSKTRFAWSAVTSGGTVSYKYYFGTSSSPSAGNFVSTNNTSIVTSNLLPGATYYFQAIAVSTTNGESSNCTSYSFSTLAQAGVPVCPTITSPSATGVVTTTPTVTWGTVTNAFKYTLVVSRNTAFTDIAYSNSNISGSATSFAIPSALAGSTTYYLRLTPRNNLNESPSAACNYVTFRTEVANNDRAGAIQLSINNTCNSTAGTSIDASASLPANGINVSNANDDDVWYRYTATGTGNIPVTITVTGGTTTGTLQNPVIEIIAGTSGFYGIFDNSTGATEVATISQLAGTYYFRVYSRSSSVASAGSFNVCVIGATTVSGTQTLSGSYGSLTIPNGSQVTIGGTSSFGDVTVENGGTLIIPGNTVISGNIFNLKAGGNLIIGSNAGISASAANGNVQFATRNFSTEANYTYNGTAAQSTGSGLPATVNSLGINNSNGVTLSSGISILDNLTVTSGTFASGTNNVTFKSTAAKTARLAQMPATGAAITGSNFTVERNGGTYSSNANTASGAYYFLGTSVTGATLNNWSLAGLYSQVFAGAATTPSVYTYTEGTGWSAGSASTSMNPGKGVQIWADLTVQRSFTPFAISGTGITYGNVDMNLAYSTTGFNLVANPYPSAIDFGQVRTASTNVENSFYVWSHLYRSYQVVTAGSSNFPSGTGVLSNTLASSQGFIVKATQAGATLSFREAHKVSATGTTLGRVASVPSIKFNLNGNGVTSFASIFFNENATRNFDADYDGQMLSGSANVSTYSADNHRLSNNSMPNPTGTDSVRINLSNTVAGTYTLTFSELANLPAGMRVFLKDNTNGSITEINEGFSLSTNLAANGNNNRYVIIYVPSSVTSTASLLGNGLLSVFPNPATGSTFTIRTSGFENENANLVITDAVGKTVFTKEIVVGELPVSNTINANLPAGVYNVTCLSGKTSISTKLVVSK